MEELEYRLITGDSLKVVPELIRRGETETFSLCVTSPPYWNLVEYNSGCGDLSLMKSDKEFEDKLTELLKGVYRLLNKYGTLVLQWEDITIDRCDGYTGEYMLCSINHAAERAGFRLYSRFIWKKFEKKDIMYCSYDMAQARLGRCNPSWTYLFVYKHKNEAGMCPNKSEVTREEWNKWSSGIWDIYNPAVGHHNTPYAPELVDRVLRLYTAPGDKVLDPFVGSGTTMKVCVEANRACTGVELNTSYIDKIREYVKWGQQSLGYKNKYVYEVIK